MIDLVKKISEIASRAKTEEDLKMGVEPLIRDLLSKQIGIEIIPEYELRTGFRGRRDAVYGHLTIEYKKPGELSSKEKLNRAAEQLARYLEDAAKYDEYKGEEALKRVAGACLDGEKIFFLRYWPAELSHARPLSTKKQLTLFDIDFEEVKGGFQLIGPYLITPESLDELFRYMRALLRKPLSPEALAEEFGPGTETAQKLVGSFYQSLTCKDSEAVKTLFDQWTRTFGVIYGEETSQAEKDIPELAKGYGLPKAASLKHSLFAVHTYFALIMKLIAVEVVSLQQGSFSPSLISQIPAKNSAELKNQMADLENGGAFSSYGIVNFLEGDFFRWYLNLWDEDIAGSIRLLATKLSDFEPTTPVLRPGEARDLLKKLYQYLVPKKLRHDLGEYYTPDWIAERLLNQLGYDGNPDTRILDPACGSGTFLTIAIDRARGFMQENLLDRDPQKRKKCAEKILQNIVGFDLNPLAVIAARTNYLLVFGDLIRDVRPIEIPVYICDSILTPVLQKQAQGKQLIQASLFDEEETVDYFYLPTTAGDFIMPKAVLDKKALEKVTNIIEECISSTYKSEEFISRIKMEVDLSSEGAYRLLEELYIKIFELNEKGKNGIWARLLKNSFAPVLQESFDLIAGNPPWVNWESLAKEWRDLSKQLWDNYGLFSLKGHAARLGGGKKDLAMLFTYTSADHYLKVKGRLGFVITQTIFKTKGAGDGFRLFKLGETGHPLKVMHVDDMSELQPFEGATNRTAILVLQKGQPTRYPVSYSLWRKKDTGKIPLESSLQDAASRTRVNKFEAVPVDGNDSSPWMTGRPYALRALQKVIGESDYKAWAGACGWLNSVFWVRIIEQRPDNMVIIENLNEIGKIKVQKIRTAIEPDLLYPLLRGRDIRRWVATPSAYNLITQNPETRTGWSEDIMKTKWPHTYSYLKQFEEILRNRSGFKKYFNPKKDPFWSMYNIGPYTLSPYKVVWKEQSKIFTCTCCSDYYTFNDEMKNIIPDHKLMLVPFENDIEAYYLSALLNTKIAQFVVKSYVISTSTSTHILKNIRVPKFQSKDANHVKLANLSKEAHSLAKKSDIATIDEIEKSIEITAAELWEIEKKELEAIQRSLKELQ